MRHARHAIVFVMLVGLLPVPVSAQDAGGRRRVAPTGDLPTSPAQALAQ